ncbi:hypothetical protein NHX12_030747 [Muraenolepis orangiensis]|uniref:Uncharacterized protein n=1 Tax=Muraenolepis orangiensis TaxID=630683 RepID=A0A9Q0ECD5_9TELE|nr:hypothetical protein NHX12_030747 [Muraenolepis orangiensis]
MSASEPPGERAEAAGRSMNERCLTVLPPPQVRSERLITRLCSLRSRSLGVRCPHGGATRISHRSLGAAHSGSEGRREAAGRGSEVGVMFGEVRE